MNKRQLAGKLSGTINITRIKAEQIVDTILECISDGLKAGEKIRLVGFGNFVVRSRKGRIGRNPRTGEKMNIGPSYIPTFIPGINLKKIIKSNFGSDKVKV